MSIDSQSIHNKDASGVGIPLFFSLKGRKKWMNRLTIVLNICFGINIPTRIGR
jgi:hypothetical protein